MALREDTVESKLSSHHQVLMGHHSDSGTLKGGYESDGIIDLVKNTKEMYIPLL